MKLLLVLALLATGILFLGCTYSANYSYNTSVNASTNNTPTGGNATLPPAHGTSNGGPSGSNVSGNPPAPVNESPSPQPQAPSDLTGKNYTDLLLSGFASQCTATIRAEGKIISLKLFFDGKGNMTYEEAATGLNECPSASMVYKGDLAKGGKMYATCPGHQAFLGSDFKTDTPCAWRSMDISAEFGGIGSSSLGFGSENETYSTPPIDMAPAFSCQPWTLDGSKFDVKGFVCD